MAKGLNYERRMRLASRFSKPAPKATSYNRFGRGIRDREEDAPTKVFGAITGGILPNATVLKRAAQDPTGTALGAVEVASLASPIANAYRAYNLLSGGDFSVTGAGMEDVEQFTELASLIPSGKAVSASLKAATKVVTNPMVRAGITSGAKAVGPSLGRGLTSGGFGELFEGVGDAARGGVRRVSRETPTYNINPTPKQRADAAAAAEYGRPVVKKPEDPLFIQGLLDLGMGKDTPLARIISSRFPLDPVNNPSRVPVKELADPLGEPIRKRTASVTKRERRDIKRAGQDVTTDIYTPPRSEDLAAGFSELGEATKGIDVNPVLYRAGVVVHQPQPLFSLIQQGKPIGKEVRAAGGDVPNWAQGRMEDAEFLQKLIDEILVRGDAKTVKAARELAAKFMITRTGR